MGNVVYPILIEGIVGKKPRLSGLFLIRRKILLILTDGVPDAFRPCELAIHSAIRLGVEVCGIGIRHAAIRRLLPDRSNAISTLTELAPAIFRLLQTHLLQGDDA